ncbi:hypothetical protein [Leucobacter luti]|uniref:hypothetical protein n=1 Tax=Leucobacter luti TaxID=340320 RepID=UPI001C689B73|nr:hypothetical protein [Leucobacter luti]QYM76931.1 hypothetical protein K1X41_06015 [Leucobacter luti]
MFARARIALGAAMVEHPHLRDFSTFEIIDVVGEGADWTAAKAACQIPDGALLLSWINE